MHIHLEGLSKEARNRLGLLMLIVLALAYLLIAASFAPSAYGQSYPVPRARFAGRVIMTIALDDRRRFDRDPGGTAQYRLSQPAPFACFAILVLVILHFILYELPGGRLERSLYISRARQSGTEREAEILALKARGEQDLVVRFLSEVPIQDLGDHKGYRLNRCAAALYGVNSIVAVPMEEKNDHG